MQDSPAFSVLTPCCRPCLFLDSALSPVPRYPTLPSEPDADYCLLFVVYSCLLFASVVVNKVNQTSYRCVLCVLHLGSLPGRYTATTTAVQTSQIHLAYSLGAIPIHINPQNIEIGFILNLPIIERQNIPTKVCIKRWVLER